MKKGWYYSEKGEVLRIVHCREGRVEVWENREGAVLIYGDGIREEYEGVKIRRESAVEIVKMWYRETYREMGREVEREMREVLERVERGM